MAPTTVAIVQARMGSSRLPGKVMMDLCGEPLVARVVLRTSRAATLDGVIVATTSGADDDPIVGLCADRGWPCFTGSEQDVLDRYYRAACEHGAEVVVRVTADNPVIDPGLIDRVVNEFLELQPDLDYASNTLTHNTYPIGLSAEAMRFDALQRAWREAEEPAHREHVTPFIYGRPDLFRLHGVYNESDCSQHRWTVDTPEDMELVRLIYGHFADDDFTWREALTLVEANPEWQRINHHVVQSTT